MEHLDYVCKEAWLCVAVPRKDDASVVQEDAVRFLQAAASSQTLQTVDIRGTNLLATAVEAACHLLLVSCCLETARVTTANTAAHTALANAAARSPNKVKLVISTPPTGRPIGAAMPQQIMVASTNPVPELDPYQQQPFYAAHAFAGQSRLASRPTTAGSMSTRQGAAGKLSIGGSVASSQGTAQSRIRKQPFPQVDSDTPSLKPRVSNLPAKLAARAQTAGLSAGGAAERAAMAFLRADDKGAGVISSAKVARALNELGLLKNLQPSQVHLNWHCHAMSWSRMLQNAMFLT
jgi:hypothetical protein